MKFKIGDIVRHVALPGETFEVEDILTCWQCEDLVIRTSEPAPSKIVHEFHFDNLELAD